MQDNTKMHSGYKRRKKGGEHGGTNRGRYQGGPRGGYGHGHGHEDMVEEVVDPPHVSIAVRLVMSHDFSLSHTCSVHIVIVLNM
jgi:hypothetical protein